MKNLLEKVKSGEIPIKKAERQINELMAKKEAEDNAIFSKLEPKAGTVIYYKRASESLAIGILIIALVIVELLFDYLFIDAILKDWNQRFTALFLGMASLVVGFIIMLYMYGFLPDVLVVKHRMRKYVPSKENSWWSFK